MAVCRRKATNDVVAFGVVSHGECDDCGDDGFFYLFAR